ncbi:hypothetical protein [Cohnella mopanensis]|uniref:hypothetical protein n=1 Tax=Cohnella mopanensis TaxID=2911966 RepID=UPI001EF888B3|nr:hypothetical protein [Cohnella mopanensis]
MKSKEKMVISGPASRLKEYLSQAGFVRDFIHRSTYRLELRSATGVLVFQVPFEETDGALALYGETAFFDGISDSDVPEDIQIAALDRWQALRARIGIAHSQVYSPDRGDRQPSAPIRSRSIQSALNGSMVQDLSDMKRLGKDMERMKTEQQLNEDGLVNDPIQY